MACLHLRFAIGQRKLFWLTELGFFSNSQRKFNKSPLEARHLPISSPSLGPLGSERVRLYSFEHILHERHHFNSVIFNLCEISFLFLSFYSGYELFAHVWCETLSVQITTHPTSFPPKEVSPRCTSPNRSVPVKLCNFYSTQTEIPTFVPLILLRHRAAAPLEGDSVCFQSYVNEFANFS